MIVVLIVLLMSWLSHRLYQSRVCTGLCVWSYCLKQVAGAWSPWYQLLCLAQVLACVPNCLSLWCLTRPSMLQASDWPVVALNCSFLGVFHDYGCPALGQPLWMFSSISNWSFVLVSVHGEQSDSGGVQLFVPKLVLDIWH